MKRHEKPITQKQIAAIRKIAADNNMRLENLCWYLSGFRTQIINNLTYDQAAKFLKRYGKDLFIGPYKQ